MESENERPYLLARLKERATMARAEKTGTALGDALHFEESADAIERLTRELAETRGALQRRADELNVLQGSIAAYQSSKIESERDALRAEVKRLTRERDHYARERDVYREQVHTVERELAETRK